MVSAHGYAVLHLSGFLNRVARSTGGVAREATALSRLLAAAAQAQPANRENRGTAREDGTGGPASG